jgi:hypothetical protein
MAEVRRRRSTATVSRRRDRVREDEEPEEDEGEEEEEKPRRRSRTRPSSNRPASRSRSKDEEDEEDEEDDDEEDEDEEEEEEEQPRSRRGSSSSRARTSSRRSSSRRSSSDDDAEAPRARRRASGQREKTKAPLGVSSGWKGAEEVAQGNTSFLKVGNQPELIVFLEPEPFADFRQHWVPAQKGQGNVPFTCAGKERCALCKGGDRPNAQIYFNVLWLSAPDEPLSKILRLGQKAFEALKTSATHVNRKTGESRLDIMADYWAIRRSGSGSTSQTNFKEVSDDDLEDEWGEIFENFEFDDLEGLIEEAKERCYDRSIVPPASPRKLEEQARYLNED